MENKQQQNELAFRIARSIREDIERLSDAVHEVRSSRQLRAYLNVMARFHSYSWRNALIIALTRPDAQIVAGFRTWKSLGRTVRKGETGIRILAPIVWRRASRQEGEAVQAPSPTDVKEADPEPTAFRTACVFDVSQTDGTALPEYDVPEVGEPADALLESLLTVAKNRGIEVRERQLAAGHFGVSRGGVIELATGYGTGQRAKTLCHELAHEALHRGPRKAGAKPGRCVRELEAEAVAYVVCRRFGLDVEVRASRYIALWGGDAKGLSASLGRISRTARDLIKEAVTRSKTMPALVPPMAARIRAAAAA